MKDNDAINTIEKFGAEGLLHFGEQFLLHPFIRLLLGLGLIATGGKTNSSAFPDKVSADITGHNYNAVTKIHPAALGIG